MFNCIIILVYSRVQPFGLLFHNDSCLENSVSGLTQSFRVFILNGLNYLFAFDCFLRFISMSQSLLDIFIKNNFLKKTLKGSRCFCMNTKFAAVTVGLRIQYYTSESDTCRFWMVRGTEFEVRVASNFSLNVSSLDPDVEYLHSMYRGIP